ncbi:MAG: exodeoxyribonuclease V subunit gamma [Thiohalomonadaceae bacterium]
MLRVYHSNRLERLCERLVEVTGEPLPDPMAPEWFLVQTQGMARWLSLQLAERTGIAANLRFFMPAAFVWRLLAEQIPEAEENSAWDRDTLVWRILGLLPQFLDRPGFAPLRQYLGGERPAFRRWQLARRIADVFDQYLVYRPDLIQDWEQGVEPQDWQAQLWRALAAQPCGPHRVKLLQRFLSAAPDTARLPARVCVFAVPSIPPAYLAVLARLAEVIDVHLFVLNPCLLYWGDIRDERNLARLRRQWARLGQPDRSAYFSVGHPLLASMGRPARDFIELLHDHPLEDEELFEIPQGESLLAHLQRDILLLDGEREHKTPLDDEDVSLQVHACHGPMREMEVLHDQLQALFDKDASLSPRDVVVMAPDIDAYSPYIEAVFGAAPEGRHIPWTIADRSRAASAPVLSAFLALIDLPRSRFTASEVLSILEVPAVLRRAGLDENDYEQARAWVRASHIRWGLDGKARAAAGLPEDEANTWAFGFRRLLLGYGMAPEAELFNGVLPYAHVEGTQAETLGRLRSFVERLERFAARLQGQYTADGWVALVNELLEAFFDTDEDDTAPLQAVREAMDSLREQAGQGGYREAFGLDILRDHMQRVLTESAPEQRFIAGPVTFCSLVPLRSVPFRVVCLVGMNDQAFPRVQRPLGFDRMAQQPRPGDRSRRDDDRYAFLEALLAARDVLYISYEGRDLRDNNLLLPSVLVSELLDHVEQGFAFTTGEVREHLVVEHALQPFSTRYFGADARLFSYAGEWLPGAQAQAGERRAEAPFCAAPLAEAEQSEPVVEVADLIDFFRHPARHFLRRRLGIVLDDTEAVLEDTEPFALDRLAGYLVQQDLLIDALQGGDSAPQRPRLLAEGLLPSGHFGALAFEDCTASLDDYVAALRPHLGTPLQPLEVDLELAGTRLRGWLDGLTDHGLLRYRHGKLGANDVLALWIRHLVHCAINPDAGTARHVAGDVHLTLAPVAEPMGVLAELLRIYRSGSRQPLPFFPRTAWAFAQAETAGKDAMAAARAVWEPNEFSNANAEATDPYNAMAFRGIDEPLDDTFAQLAHAVFAPVLAVASQEALS